MIAGDLLQMIHKAFATSRPKRAAALTLLLDLSYPGARRAGARKADPAPEPDRQAPAWISVWIPLQMLMVSQTVTHSPEQTLAAGRQLASSFVPRVW